MGRFWIDHPAVGHPVGFWRWFKWRLSVRLDDWARRLEWSAFYPTCSDCGKPRDEGDHSKCIELPF